VKRLLAYLRNFQGVVDILSKSADLQDASASPHDPTTILTDLAQIAMDFALAINAAALQPRMLDQTQQSLVVFSACRLRLRQSSVITTGMDFQRQAKPSNGIVARSLLDKGVLQPHSLAKYAAERSHHANISLMALSGVSFMWRLFAPVSLVCAPHWWKKHN
jgi:hypothetical protein